MKRWFRALGLAAVAGLGLAASSCSDAAAADSEMTVYASPSCGCCGAWVDHMRENGFTVRVVYDQDLAQVRARHHLPNELMSCHLGVVDGYAVEGHVPAQVVRRLIEERPEVLGIAAPGMPAGSPGMEMPDGSRTPYEVVSWNEDGPVDVFEFVN